MMTMMMLHLRLLVLGPGVVLLEGVRQEVAEGLPVALPP